MRRGAAWRHQPGPFEGGRAVRAVFAPDPSSQKASTIGGNIANNAGGPHCLSLGVTVNHILGLEVVLHDGSVVDLGGKSADAPGLDLTGVLVGSEGTLGVVTEATVRLLPLPEAVRTTLAIFESVEAASEAVSGLIGGGLVPAALEMMDRLALSAIEAAFHAGYPPEAGAVLLVEVDGLLEQVEAQAAVVDAVCRKAGALEIRLARTADDGPACGPLAKAPPVRWAASRRTTTCTMPSSHGRSCRRSSRRSSRSDSATTCRSPTCSTPGMATCTR